jgi:hypothetical protein
MRVESNVDPVLEKKPIGARAEKNLETQWRKALDGDLSAQQQWRPKQGGEWRWSNEGVLLESAADWASLEWLICDARKMAELKNLLIEVTVSGKADAAGLSYGDYKDFLVQLKSSNLAHRLQFEIDVEMGCWAFRVDGQLQEQRWWNSSVRSVDDLLEGFLTLKAKSPTRVLFQNLSCRTFQSSCRLSVITTCYRFAQRLRVTLRNWCHQELPLGSYELLIINPGSPDGTHEHLAAVSSSFPHVRIREVAVASNLAKNKGAMINHAIAASRGEWLWLTDADCLFAPDSARYVLDQIGEQPDKLYFGQRRFLTPAQTAALLSGRADGLRDFQRLALEAETRSPENVPWGYTQIAHRSTVERVRYREQFNHFAHSDGIFVEDCKRLGINPHQVDGLFCLHLDHPFSWWGTNSFL